MIRYLSLLLLIGLAFGSDSERIISKWDNGVTKRIQYYRGSGFDEELIGVKTFYPNGDLRWKCRYQNNKRHGEYLFYLEGNKLLLEGKYANGDVDSATGDGKWYAYHPDKIKGYGFFYANDKYTISVEFHDNGELKSYTPSINRDYKGFLMYNSYSWYSNGGLKGINKMVQRGNGEDEYISNMDVFYENGKPKYIAEFGPEMKKKLSKLYYPNGNIKSSENEFGMTIYYKPDGTIDYTSQ